MRIMKFVCVIIIYYGCENVRMLVKEIFIFFCVIEFRVVIYVFCILGKMCFWEIMKSVFKCFMMDFIVINDDLIWF